MAGFDAFISYSRRASTTLATDLQSAVERFAKPWYRLRAVRVFRDDASMSANPGLWPAIEKGLTEAGWFVLVASPAAAASTYVGREVTWWREHKDPERILIVLEEGADIVWDPVAGDFDLERTDALPPAIAGAFVHEPRWIDLRWYEQPGSLGAKDPRWSERVADVAAAVRGVERDELIGENVRQHRLARRLLRGGVATLALLLVASLVATFVAVGQRSEAQRQRNEAREQRDVAEEQARVALARQLAAQAVSLAGTDLRTASLLAARAFRTHDDAQTRSALFQVASATPQLVRTLPTATDVAATATTPDGVVVTGETSGAVVRWQGAEPTELFRLDDSVRSVAVSDDGSVVAATDGSAVVRWAGAAAEPLDTAADTFAVAVAPDGGRTAVLTAQPAVSVWSAGSATAVTAPVAPASVLALSDEFVVAGGQVGEWTVVDPRSGSTASVSHTVPMTAAVAVSGDLSTIASSNGLTDWEVWRGDAAYDDQAAANAAASGTEVPFAFTLSRSGALAASAVSGVVEVATVRAVDDPPTTPLRLEGTGRLATSGSLSFGGDRFLALGAEAGAFVWDLEHAGRLGRDLPAPVPDPCTACGPVGTSVSPDGRRVAVWSRGPADGSPVVVDLESGAATSVGSGAARLSAFAWVAADRLLAFDDATSGLAEYDLTTGQLLPVPGTPVDGSVTALQVRGGTAWVMTREGPVWAVDLTTGAAEVRTALAEDPFGEDATAWSVAPDGTTAAVVTRDAEYASRVLVLDLRADRIAFDGPGLAAAYDGESRLHVFDGVSVGVVVDGALADVRPAPGVTGVPAPALSPDARLVATGGSGADVQVLDLTRQGALVGTVPVPRRERLYSVPAFAPDGAALVVAVPEVELVSAGRVELLDLDPDAWVTAACALAARDLTEAEWSRYGVGPAPDDLRCDP